MLRDWRAGRAFWDQRGFYRIFALVRGTDGVVRKSSSARKAPWSDLALELFPGSSGGLHAAAELEYPLTRRTAFGRLHALDPVASKLLCEIAKEELDV
jgi:hypothetical protein